MRFNLVDSKEVSGKVRSFFKTSRNLPYLLIVPALFLVGTSILYSAPPGNKYQPGETLDPNCGPGDPNCSVEIKGPLWSESPSGIHYSESGKNVGVGTNSPQEAFHVSGNSLFGGNIRLNSTGYINYGSTFGTSGYGFRDNAGTLEFKDSAGNWTAFSSLSGGGGGGTETDPTVPDHVKNITSSNISNWNSAFSWGDHSTAGYLTNFVELDPTVPGHVKNISTTNISDWNTAFGWGNHAVVGYLTSESDPTVPSHVKSILSTDITNWNTAFSWGDHSIEGYLKSFTESDPTVPAHVKSITSSNISNWSTAFSWGDHSLVGYLTSFTETDPTVPSYVKNILAVDIANWNSAYSWGDHAVEGYLKSYTETDPTVPAHVKGILLTDISNWNSAYSWGDHSLEGYLKTDNINTSAKLASIVSDETGTGSLVFNTNPIFSGNVQLASAGYLNWGTTSGLGGYGFRDNNGVMEFKDISGSWISFDSLTESSSLWSLHANDQDVFRDIGNVGIGDPEPSTRLSVAGGSILVTGTHGDGGGITVTGGGTRMFFDTNKSAFRAGQVANDQWNDDNVGEFSSAFGGGTVASGTFSTAFGYNATASQHASMAFGFNTQASGAFSTAFGYGSTASNFGSTAWGSSVVSSGNLSTAWGSGTVASEFLSTAWGLETKAEGDRSTAWGSGSLASEFLSTAWGLDTKAEGDRSTAFGFNTTASGFLSTVWGSNVQALGYLSSAWGSNTIAQGDLSTAWGLDSKALSDFSTAFGHAVEASNDGSTAFGWYAKASGFASTAFGDETVASGDRAVAFGRESVASGDYSTAFGWGTSATKFFDTSFGHLSEAQGGFSTAFGRETLASGESSTAWGINTVAQSFGSTALGRFNAFAGNSEEWISTDPLFVIGNGEGEDSRSNALTVLKNGNVGLIASGYLNWGSVIGEDGYGFRDNNGVMEFKDVGGNWIALSSLGGGSGGGESLWSLHSNGQDIFRNTGNVGINTINPTAQFESTSNSIAAWFRGKLGESAAPWDFEAMVSGGRFELSSDDSFEACNVEGGAFSTDGTKLFLVGRCFLTGGLGLDDANGERYLASEPSSPNSLLSVHEFDLSRPWDVTSATDTGRSYDPFDDADAHPWDVTFSPDGLNMYIINDEHPESDTGPWGAVIHQYSLSEAWTFSGGVSHVEEEVLNDAHIDYVYNIEFSADGTKVFLNGEYNDGNIWAYVWGYELGSAYDISTLQQPAITGGLLEEYIVGSTFSDAGDKLFMLVEGWNPGEYEIIEITLDTPWDLNGLHNFESERYVVDINDLEDTEHFPTDLILKSDGSGFYTTFSAVDPFDWDTSMMGGISQYVGATPQVEGGTVLVDGKLGVGLTNPIARFESISNTIAGWFRGESIGNATPWDLSRYVSTGQYEVIPQGHENTCAVDGGSFSADGTKLFLAGSCYEVLLGRLQNTEYRNYGPSSHTSMLSVHEFHLSTPWDINSITDSGKSYDPWEDTGAHPLDVQFSSNGLKMFVINEYTYPGPTGLQIHEYSLDAPWDISTEGVTYEGGKVLDEGGWTGPAISEIYNFRFNADGTRLFVSGKYVDDDNQIYADMWSYDLPTPYDIQSIDKEDFTLLDLHEVLQSEVNLNILFPTGPFEFDISGNKLYVLLGENTWADSAYVIASISLDNSWDISAFSVDEFSVTLYNFGEFEGGYKSLIFSPAGTRFYAIFSNLDKAEEIRVGGIRQFDLTTDKQGGNVIIDGRLGVGTSSPSSKLTVVGNSELRGDVNITGGIHVGAGSFGIAKEGMRLAFDPISGALRVGYAGDNSWDPFDMGQASVAFGAGTTAFGDFSMAFGGGAHAEGLASTAFGFYTYAEGAGSTAFGEQSYAAGDISLAFGINTYAGGEGSTAFGLETNAEGLASTAFGIGTEAESYGSVAFGAYNTVSGIESPYSWELTDTLLAVGNGLDEDNRSNALTILKNGNVGFGASTYLTWGNILGESGYGFRDNNGVVEFKDAGGNWMALSSLVGAGGGEDLALWTLNADGNAIYNNGGKVGINTLDPSHQFEVVSSSVAARFRSSNSPWDVDNISQTEFYEISDEPGYFVGGGRFNSNGTRLFTVEYDGTDQRIVEYHLSKAWDLSTISNSGKYHDVSDSIDLDVMDIAFNGSGNKLFALSSDGGDVAVHQYSLGVSWDISSAVLVKSQALEMNSGLMTGASSIRFSRDGSSLFILGMVEIVSSVEGGHIVQYDLDTPWDIGVVTEVADEDFSVVGASIISTARLFDFSSDGERLFVGVLDTNTVDGSYEVSIQEFSLGTPWSLLGTIQEEGDSLLESGADVYEATVFTGFAFSSDGHNAYTTQSSSSLSLGSLAGVTQYSLGGGSSSGGSVVVDGTLAVGTNSPAFKLHVTTAGTGAVAGFTNDNGTCTIDPNTSSLSCSSDERLKTEILTIGASEENGSSLSRLLQLRPVSYRWEAEAGTDAPLRYGLIAQEVKGVFPELVTMNPWNDTLSVSYGGFTPFIIDAIKELDEKIDFMTNLSSLTGDSSSDLGGSLADVIMRSLKNAVLRVQKVFTKEICLEGEGGAHTCIDKQKLDRLLDMAGEGGQENSRESEPPKAREDNDDAPKPEDESENAPAPTTDEGVKTEGEKEGDETDRSVPDTESLPEDENPPENNSGE